MPKRTRSADEEQEALEQALQAENVDQRRIDALTEACTIPESSFQALQHIKNCASCVWGCPHHRYIGLEVCGDEDGEPKDGRIVSFGHFDRFRCVLPGTGMDSDLETCIDVLRFVCS